ncbi:MAG TPA: hypothetical protein VHZ56_01335 [Devosia sp.]|nr:hypothetical protein [Devosia sp.]
MPPRTLLFISNGHGEDSIAAEIVRRLPPGFAVAAYPTLGDGHAYAGVCPLVGPRRHLPSQGQRRRGSFWRDARSGYGIGAALRFMRTEAPAYDAIVVVGDLLGIVMCWWSGNRVRLYLDVYKSGFANRYSGLERWIVRRSCDLVLTRDPILAAQLETAGVAARFAGNVMMDTLVTGPYDAAGRRAHPRAVALLPGSRAATADNLALQLAALRLLPDAAGLDLFAALAPGTDAASLARGTGLVLDGDTLRGDGLSVHLSTGSLGAVLAASDIVLGQGGTANLQALGMGKPVISFLAEDARPARRRRIAALAGDSRIVTERTPEALAAALAALLADPAEIARRGAIGRERMGPPGAIAAIIAELQR